MFHTTRNTIQAAYDDLIQIDLKLNNPRFNIYIKSQKAKTQNPSRIQKLRNDRSPANAISHLIWHKRQLRTSRNWPLNQIVPLHSYMQYEKMHI